MTLKELNMSDETNTNTANPAAAAPAPQEDNTVDLTLNDLAAIKSIIDVASSRGAFKPAEMVAVGSVYAKLEKFLELAAKQSQAAQASNGQAAPNA
jgi:hypothetical protein